MLPKKGLLEVPKNVASFFHGSVGVGTCKVLLGHSGVEELPAQSGITPSSWPRRCQERPSCEVLESLEERNRFPGRGGAMRAPEGQAGGSVLPFRSGAPKFVRGPQWRRGAFWQLLRVLRVETMPKAGVMELPGREMVESQTLSEQ